MYDFRVVFFFFVNMIEFFSFSFECLGAEKKLEKSWEYLI